MSGLVVFVVVAVLLVASALVCALEVAYLFASRARLHQLYRQHGNVKAKLVLDIMQRPDVLLATLTLILNTLNIAASALTTVLLVRLFGEVGVAYATALMTMAIFVVSEALPKTIGTRFPESIATTFAQPVWMLEQLCRPIILPVKYFNETIMRVIGLAHQKRPAFTESDLRGAISLGLEYGALRRSEFHMLDAVLNLDDMMARDVMVDKGAIVALDVNTPPAQLPKVLGAYNHTHVPVFEKRPGNFIGILAIRDYLNALGQAAKRSDVVLKDILRPLYTVPENTPLGQQLFAFSESKYRHMALVTSAEPGAEDQVVGLVTLEDILEEITGHAGGNAKGEMKIGEDGSVTLPGDTPVAEANKAYGWKLPENVAVTLAGLMVETVGHLPTQGESATVEGMSFHVVYKRGHRIETLKILKV